MVDLLRMRLLPARGTASAGSVEPPPPPHARSDAERGRRSDPIVVWGVAVAVVLAAAETVSQLVDFGLYGLRVELLDSSTNASLFGIVSLVLCAAAAAAAALGFRTGAARRGGHGIAAACVTVVLALRVEHPPRVLLLGAPVAAVALLALWWVSAGGTTAARVVRIGCGLLAVSYAAHALGPGIVSALGDSESSWAYQVKVVLKHGGEIAGWGLVGAGLASLVTSRRARGTAAC